MEEIESTWPGSIIYKEENLDKPKRLALWSITDFHLNTALSDGQSITPLEFISVKKAENKLVHSAVIIS